jgi:Flp pilus assembly protein TadB
MSVVDTPSFAASMVLVAMGFVSSATSLALRLKSRELKKYPENVQIGIFKRTFNVFSPYPERRKVIHENLQWLILIACYGSFVGIGLAIMKIFEFGFLLAFITLVICLGFLLIDETLEIHKNTGIFLNAFKRHALFGKGDLEALDFLRQTLPRLSNYHLMIAVAFFATSLAVPFVVSFFLLSFSGLAGFIFTAVATVWFFPPLVLLFTALIFGATIFTVQLVANRVKTGILSFPSPEGALEGMWAQTQRSGRYFPHAAWSIHHPKPSYLPDAKHLKEEEAQAESDK